MKNDQSLLVISAEVSDTLPPGMAQVYSRAMREAQALCSTDEGLRRFAHVVLTQLRTTPALQACSQESLVACLIKMAMHGLDPSSMNECFLIPYKGEATLQIGYAGLMKLALSHPDVLDVFCDEVCANDLYQFLGVDQSPRHIYPDAFRPRGAPIGYYAVAKLTGGRWRAVQMSVAEVKAHAKSFSLAYQQGKKVWKEEGGGGFRGMARKTVLRALCHPRNLPMQGAVAQLMTEGEHQEAEVRILDQAQRLAPQIALESTKSLDAHIEDLYGRAPSANAGHALKARIDALMAEQGLSPGQQASAWERWSAKYPDLTPAALTIIYDSLADRVHTLSAQAVDAAMGGEDMGQDREPGDEDEGDEA